MRIEVGEVSAHKRWSGATLTFSEYRGYKPDREVVIVIDDPWDLCEIRRKLNEIEQGWLATLEHAKP